jgi:hypothetical protein
VFLIARRAPEVSLVSSLVPTSTRKPKYQIGYFQRCFIININKGQKETKRKYTYPYGLLLGNLSSQSRQ